MAPGRNIRAGGAFVEFFGKDSALQATFRSVGERAAKLGVAMRMAGLNTFKAGAAVLSPLLGATTIFSKVGSELADMSARTGVSVEQLSTLGYAAKQSDASLEDLQKGVVKMQQGLADAGAGSESAAKAFDKIGVSARDLQGLSPDEQLRRVATGIAGIQDPAARTAAAMDLFGKSGVALLPMLAEGGAGIANLQSEAKGLGLEVSTLDATKASVLGDTFDRLMDVVKKTVFQVGAALAPALTSAMDLITKVAVIATEWISTNRGLVVSVAMVAAGVTVAGGSIYALSLLGPVLAIAMQGAALAIGGISAVLGFLVAPIAAVKVAFLALWGVITAPVTLVVAAIAGLVYWSGAGGKALTWLKEAFGPLGAVAKETFTIVREAIANGNWSGAARLA